LLDEMTFSAGTATVTDATAAGNRWAAGWCRRWPGSTLVGERHRGTPGVVRVHGGQSHGVADLVDSAGDVAGLDQQAGVSPMAAPTSTAVRVGQAVGSFGEAPSQVTVTVKWCKVLAPATRYGQIWVQPVAGDGENRAHSTQTGSHTFMP
jgi:hypothetical protein